jgi:hypothetical protein
MRAHRLVPLLSLSAFMMLVALIRTPIFASAPHRQQSSGSAGQNLPLEGIPSLHVIADSARNTDLRWQSFLTYKAESANSTKRTATPLPGSKTVKSARRLLP